MLSLGQRLRDRYRIDALPDPDSGLNIYRAFDLTDSRLCAVKEYEGEQAARLEREAEALTLHRHPNLPIAYEALLEDSRLYVIFEWPEGESLQARLKREGRLVEGDAVRFLTQILSALDYIHTLNLPIARGGFAPAHIWIAPDGRPRLYAGLVAITNAAPYIAPEGGTDPRAALYSAGATLYNLLTGRSPEGTTSPRKYNPSLSNSTAQVIQRSLNPRPDARFATIRDMRKALGRTKSPEATPAPARRLPLIPIAIGLALLVLIILGGLFLRNPGTTVAARNTDTQTPQPTTAPPTVQPSNTPTTEPSLTPTVQPAATATRTPTVVPSPTPNLTPQAGATVVAQTDAMILIFVPAGDFLMGSPDSDLQAFGNEKPQHTVSVDSFWIDQTEVTNVQYRACVAAKACTNPSGFDSSTRTDYFNDPQYDNYPVIWVNWRQANAYCTWAGRRLPTESEWEKAARGADGRSYPWGNQAPDNTLLNYNSAANDTTAVGSFPSGASPFGVLDMAGNVVEWVDGFYYDSYFTVISNTVTPTPSFLGGVRVLRSSAWGDLFENIRVASRRFSNAETNAFNDVGFRCAVGAP
jgi:serine/threonine-protein kinase